MEESVLFSESQRFRQTWLWAIFIGTGVISLAIALQGILNPVEHVDKAAVLVSTLIFLVIGVFIYVIRLDTVITSEGIYVRFFPFIRGLKKISWQELSSVEVLQYSPLGEYGGWGLRLGMFGSGKAYTISGNKGIQLIFNNGSRLLIGTSQAEEVTEALNKLKIG